MSKQVVCILKGMVQVKKDDFTASRKRGILKVGHYCKICGRTRANEKFSGKGHKNHVCKDCSGKFGRKTKKQRPYKNEINLETIVSPNTVLSKSESTYYDDNCFDDINYKKHSIEDENDEELPF